MNGFGNSPRPPQNKPFQIPGPYSSSGMFDPGVANILESGRLARLKRERDEAEWRDQQERQRQQAHQDPGAGQHYQQSGDAGGSPGLGALLVGLVLRLLRWAAIGFLILMALAILGRILG